MSTSPSLRDLLNSSQPTRLGVDTWGLDQRLPASSTASSYLIHREISFHSCCRYEYRM